MWRVVKTAIPLIAFAGMIHGCAVSESIPERTVVVNMEAHDMMGDGYVSEAFTVEKVLPLKTRNISSIDKLAIADDRLYVLDGRLHRLWAFSLDGDSLMCIDKRGHAGDEYIRITDFAVDRNGRVVIYDANSARVLRYDATGKFISSNKIGYADAFMLRANGNIVLLDNRAGKAALTEYGQDGVKLRCAAGHVVETPLSLSYLGGMAEQGDSILFTVPFDYTIYAMSGRTIKPKYMLEFPNHTVPDGLWREDKKTVIGKLGRMNEVLYIENMCLLGHHLLMSTNHNAPIVYDTDSRTVKVIGNLSLPYSVLYSSKLTFTSDGLLLANISPSNMTNGLYPVLPDYLKDMPYLASIKNLGQYEDCYWVVVAKVNVDDL